MTVPPLFVLPHDWVDAVQLSRTWPTAILDARDGSEQRRARALRPLAQRRYRIAAFHAEDVGALVAAAIASASTALTPATQADPAARRQALRVRAPRWEDGIYLDAAADEGALALALDPAEDATLRSFARATDVLLWVEGRAPLVVTLADDPEAVAGAALTLAAPLALDGAPAWPVGTVVLPLRTVWLDVAPELERLTGTIAVGALALTDVVDLAGDTGPSDGAAATPVVAALELLEDAVTLFAGQQRALLVTCFDAAGVPVEPPAPLEWTVDAPTKVRLRLGNATGTLVFLEGLNDGAGSAVVDGTVTEPDSGVSAAFSVGHAVAATAPPGAP